MSSKNIFTRKEVSREIKENLLLELHFSIHKPQIDKKVKTVHLQRRWKAYSLKNQTYKSER